MIRSVMASSSRLDRILPLLLLAAGVLLRIVWFQGVGLNDDTEYADTAYRLARLEAFHYPVESIDSLRFGMVLPLAAVYRLFGVSNITSGLFPLLCSTCTMWLTYRLGREMLSPGCGTLALAFLATFPLDIVYATQLVPSIPVVACWAAALLLFLRADARNRESRPGASLLAFLSGAMIGISWLCNEPGPLFFVVLLTWTVVNNSRWRLLALAGVGALSVFCAEAIVFRMLCGSYFWRLHVVHRTEQLVPTNTDLAYYPRVLFKIVRPEFWSQEGHFGFFPYVFLGVPFVLFRSRSRPAGALWISVVLVMLWLQFGVMTLEGRPIAKWIRYPIVLVPFALVACSHALLVLGRAFGRAVASLLIATLVTINVLFAAAAQDANRMQLADFQAIARLLGALGKEKPVYLGRSELAFIDIYLHRSRRLRPLEDVTESDLDDCFVVLSGSRNAIEDAATRARTKELLATAERKWMEIATIDAADRGIFAQFDPVVYYVPPEAHDAETLATIADPANDVTWLTKQVPVPLVPDLVEARIARSKAAIVFEWIFRDRLPAEDVRGLVCFWRLTFDGSDPWSAQPDFYVRLGWYAGGPGLFVDDGRPENRFGFRDSCSIRDRFKVRGRTVLADIPLRCLTNEGAAISLDSIAMKAGLEAAMEVNGAWVARDTSPTVATIALTKR
jgi:4-amino-4-deoxy-L-arabinose transferase-like glycosyltransferase